MSLEKALLQDLAALSVDPLRFVLWAFPWGEPGDLEGSQGPEEWQRDILEEIRDGLLTPDRAIQEATASGHGVGKSALVSWIMLWGISTFEDTRGVVTANTETQLKTKTWAELGKWYRLFVAKCFFKLTATALFSADPAHERTWRIDMVPWSERNTEAFAGLHNRGKRVILIFDEASAIPDVIWETSEGSLTDKDTQIIWAVFGNPTRNTGRFKECFGARSHRWHCHEVDAREVSFTTNKEQIARWIDDYGEDSDFVRVRVKGQFPRAGSMQFISEELVREAAQREVVSHLHEPLVLGVDVARFGDDSSVIYIRKGRDGRTHPPLVFSGVDTMTLAGRVAEEYNRHMADAVFVDGTGVGGGVVDRLRQLGVMCFDIQFGAKPDGLTTMGEPTVRYSNKRAEIWGLMKAALAAGLAIPNNLQLINDLKAPEYGFDARDAIQLERKEDMKRRGQRSPDLADALALTYALPVAGPARAANEGDQPGSTFESDYDPFEKKRIAA